MGRSVILAVCVLAMTVGSGSAAKVNSEKTISVDNKERKYVLYVPDNVSENPPLVISLHGAIDAPDGKAASDLPDDPLGRT